MGFLKNNLSWIAPAAVIAPVAVIVGVAGVLDTDTIVANTFGDAPQTTLSDQDQARWNELNTLVQAALVENKQTAPAVVEDATVSRNAPLNVLQATPEPLAVVEPVRAVEPIDTAAAVDFFASAQAKIAIDNSCENDLRSLAQSTRIYFPAGGLSADESGLIKARLIAQVAGDCPGVTVQVEGHSDPSGLSSNNKILSEKRAQAIIGLLASGGVDTSNFLAVGYGDEKPSYVNGPKGSAFYDRRVEFSIVRNVQTTTRSGGTRVWQTNASSCARALENKVAQTRLFYSPRAITVSPSELGAVYELANEAAQCDGARLRLVGHHSDQQGMREDFDTGRLRALALMGSLVSAGFESERILIGAPSRSIPVPGQPGLPNSRVDFQIIMD